MVTETFMIRNLDCSRSRYGNLIYFVTNLIIYLSRLGTISNSEIFTPPPLPLWLQKHL